MQFYALDLNMDSCFLLMQPPFFLLYSVELIYLFVLVVALHSSLPDIARDQLPGKSMKYELSLFSIFSQTHPNAGKMVAPQVCHPAQLYNKIS